MAVRTSQQTQNPILKPLVPDRVLLASRILGGLVVPVLLVAFFMLYLLPDDSGLLFAWPIKPRMSAMMLGATYLGGAYFFSRVMVARRWHAVRLGFLPVSTFAGILGIATVLHWDKFTPNHISFVLWVILYFSLPFIIPLVWYANQRVNRGQNEPAEGAFLDLAAGSHRRSGRGDGNRQRLLADRAAGHDPDLALDDHPINRPGNGCHVFPAGAGGDWGGGRWALELG